jgi:peptidyl-prolyl cis-trans isomerase B (cyclophilin B)
MSERTNQIIIYFLIVIAFILIINFAINYDYNKTKDKININENLFDKNKIIDNNINQLEETGDINMNEDTNFPIVVMETNKGDIKIKLNKEKAPITVDNFLKYVNNEFYNGTVFHRVIKDFMIQGGGFTTNGTKKETLEPIFLESNNGLKNLKGTIAMARTMDPNSATSQFFINTVDNDFLDYNEQNDGYAVFGEIIEGIDVVLNIEKIDTKTKDQHQNWPIEDIIIEKIYLQE